jgi:hypothetical protein
MAYRTRLKYRGQTISTNIGLDRVVIGLLLLTKLRGDQI